MSNSFGTQFKITTFGESHGEAIGVVIDGCPSQIPISLEQVQNELDRRRPNQNELSSPRNEKDKVQLLSGCENGISLGTPISLTVENTDANPSHYNDLKEIYRPSHADYTTEKKYGIRASSGGGRSSARETIGRVAAGSIAKQLLAVLHPTIQVLAWVDSVHNISIQSDDYSSYDQKTVDQSPVRCPEKQTSKKIEQLILKTKKEGNSLGGTIRCCIRGCPAGLGEPVFDKLEADLAKAMMSLPATKGFEIGSGFSSCQMLGSEHNDEFSNSEEKGIHTLSNNSGGVQGGISNGEDILLKVAFKPVATIFQHQNTVNKQGQKTKFAPKNGRHDPCVLGRAVPIVESMALLVIDDHILRQKINQLI
jgi:chorismate synthase